MNNNELTRLVSAMVLGDGSLRKWKGVKNAGYSFGQIAIHKDYIDWQKSVLENITGVKVSFGESKIDANGTNHQDHYCLWTKSHPFFTTLYERTYFDGRKSVSTHDLLLLDWQGLAIWYMDDGYILNSEDVHQRGSIFLCTDNYNHAEVILLQKTLYNIFNLPFNIRRRGYKKDGTILYRLVLTKKNADTFINGVKPFIFPSFEYKLRTRDSDQKIVNDIV